ncbi:beta subunit of N-acylethanolamine-hydrolyzing acid amidase-domain-containing protein [Thelonectria olida]|uniref:ceramidase n=1 Tax=Thelonectria olida TaxID=1576542 RepID=A0A9P8W0D4_9HYPO|nr:beta subunit of N-acylethanolamine-hydrolyzing acid amidase-domain-containing protein [Thelonectria olida]
MDTSDGPSVPDTSIPRFTVDLSMPPESRYDHIIAEFRDALDDCNLTEVFHDLLEILCGRTLGKVLAFASRLVFSRLQSAEESAELVGISKATSIPMHILVAYNVILDVLLGCTSGGARVVDPPAEGAELSTRMLHFRTLDWGMDELRKIIVELDYVRSPGGPVVATTVGYLGYVGVLTGVRKGLSMSLNFRPYHSRDSLKQRLSFRWHQAMVILGRRQSISSVLREILLRETSAQKDGEEKESDKTTKDTESENRNHEVDIYGVIATRTTSSSSAAYLIFCTPDRVYIIEQDHRSAITRQSDTILAAYNHDGSDEVDPQPLQQVVAEAEQAKAEDSTAEDATGMTEIVKFSLSRKAAVDKLWRKRVRKCRRRFKTREEAVMFDDVVDFLKDEDINNDETHYAVIMDPKEGTVIWREGYELASGWSGTDTDTADEVIED